MSHEREGLHENIENECNEERGAGMDELPKWNPSGNVCTKKTTWASWPNHLTGVDCSMKTEF